MRSGKKWRKGKKNVAIASVRGGSVQYKARFLGKNILRMPGKSSLRNLPAY